MYAEFFGLRELPFNNTPDPRFFYSTPDHEEALASLTYTVQECKGFVLLTGEVGTGKTLISRLMLRQFGSRIAFAHINHAVPCAADLLEAICAELEINVEPGSTIAKVIRRLHDFLLARFAQDVPVVLVLDEAQNLPDEAFELIRTIGNLEADDAKLLQIVIVGQPELQERFASPQLRQLRQRVFRSFHLSALNRSSTAAYIRFRMEVAGGGKLNVFDNDAVDRIFEYSQGLPRLINTLCDNALLSAYSADRKVIDGRFLQGVVDQLTMNAKNSSHVRIANPPTSSPVATSKSPVVPSMPNANAVGRETFEKLSRIVDDLENRVAETSIATGKMNPALSVRRELELSVRNAHETAQRMLLEATQRDRQSQMATEQLSEVLAHVRISFDGVRTLCSEATALKSELRALYDRLGARIEELKVLLASKNAAKSLAAEQVVRAPVKSPIPLRGSLGRGVALQDMARGVKQLQSLVSERNRSRSEVVTGISSGRMSGTELPVPSVGQMARDVNQLLARAS